MGRRYDGNDPLADWLLNPSNRQQANPDARFFEYRDASLLQYFFDSREVEQQKSELLFGLPARFSPEQNDRRFALVSQRQQGAEIGVRGNDDSVLLQGTLEDHDVVGGLQAVIPHVGSIVSSLPQSLR